MGVRKRMVKIGDAVTFVDAYGRERPALVTQVWGSMGVPTGIPGVNVVFISDAEGKDDQYGRQLERATSVVHQSAQPAHGYYWK
jgi:F420-0:gamma-glutamyl ligase